ncbi:MAG: tRNA pseudouridine(38-40) synthase TruA [Bacteroidetes bacterium]|nr:tRNA pseudouridine(38-40) synthase TruA [Bacteroidota bacterium]
MSRYFLEVSYKGTAYSGFQSQKNANTIQAEIEKAFEVLQKSKITLVGSSRTDAGVHALQNFFHFDFDEKPNLRFVYKMNAILPSDIVIKRVIPVPDEAHCRFDAVSREYKYCIYRFKNPFYQDRAYFFPYKINLEKLQQYAKVLMDYKDFSSFSKKRTQVKSFICDVMESEWYWQEDILVYKVKANRFLRGMVRALVATMLKLVRSEQNIDSFKQIIKSKDASRAYFGVPGKGLFLVKIEYPQILPI